MGQSDQHHPLDRVLHVLCARPVIQHGGSILPLLLLCEDPQGILICVCFPPTVTLVTSSHPIVAYYKLSGFCEYLESVSPYLSLIGVFHHAVATCLLIDLPTNIPTIRCPPARTPPTALVLFALCLLIRPMSAAWNPVALCSESTLPSKSYLAPFFYFLGVSALLAKVFSIAWQDFYGPNRLFICSR